MGSIRIKKHLESDIIHLPELIPLVGKDVEITIMEDVAAANGGNAAPIRRMRLYGTVLRYDEPFEPAISPNEWDALK